MSSILTVSQLNRYVAFKLKNDVKLSGIAVKGEISNLNINYNSGHAYFSLKDAEGLVRAVMFRNNLSTLKFQLENGMNVVAFGSVDFYERDGAYQINVKEISPVGIGAAAVSFEMLKKKLAEMGVFDASIKRSICKFPKKIAVVTSSTGAALQDILNVISRRCPSCEVVVFPTLVQGSDAPEMISKAMFEADRAEADTIILARGGGSAEDLSVFNTEKVVLAVYNSSTPVISAVGHETDTTLADYAADLRAPTPSAAAELAVPDKTDLINEINRFMFNIKFVMMNRLDEFSNEYKSLKEKLDKASPLTLIENRISYFENAKLRADNAMKIILEKLDKTIVESASKLSTLNPFAVMERGYSIVNLNGEAVSDSGNLKNGDEIEILMQHGKVIAEVKNICNG
ncbi:MAG: exodeoxyribonuclease VII large subunit [Ruminococcus sp.]|nr:exodeoxyribonuclease VII large subunit [Ruminococcus sp.]